MGRKQSMGEDIFMVGKNSFKKEKYLMGEKLLWEEKPDMGVKMDE